MMPAQAGATRVAAMLLAAWSAFASPGAGQSLGDAARGDRERRAKSAKPAKVYTDADLEARRSTHEPVSAPAPPEEPGKKAQAAEATGASPDEREAAERKRLEADWRVRFADARAKIAEAEARCWHSVVRTTFVAGIPVQQWVKEFEESEELRQARRALEDLDEEFRRTGLPPGWSRE